MLLTICGIISIKTLGDINTLLLFILLPLRYQITFHQIPRSDKSMKIAALLLLQLFVLLCQTAVVITPKQSHHGKKTYVHTKTIIERGGSDDGSPASSLSDISAKFLDGPPDQSYAFRLSRDVTGPPDRLFDWHESCSDNTQRQKIWNAYIRALELAKEAEAKLASLAEKLPRRAAY